MSRFFSIDVADEWYVGVIPKQVFVGDEIALLLRGRVSRIEADMVDVSSLDEAAVIKSYRTTTVVVTNIEGLVR